MSRTRGAFYDLTTLLSLLVLLGAAGAWVRSYRAADFHSTLEGNGFLVSAWRGQVVLIHHQIDRDDAASYLTCYLGRSGGELSLLVKGLFLDPGSVPPSAGGKAMNVQELRHMNSLAVLSRPYCLLKLPGPTRLRNGYGFALTVDRTPPWPGGHGARVQAVGVPCWFLVMAALMVPGWRAWGWWRETWVLRHPGRCAGCGYDLRATPQRCPECGRVV